MFLLISAGFGIIATLSIEMLSQPPLSGATLMRLFCWLTCASSRVVWWKFRGGGDGECVAQNALLPVFVILRNLSVCVAQVWPSCWNAYHSILSPLLVSPWDADLCTWSQTLKQPSHVKLLLQWENQLFPSCQVYRPTAIVCICYLLEDRMKLILKQQQFEFVIWSRGLSPGPSDTLNLDLCW